MKINGSHERSSDENSTIKLPLNQLNTQNNQFIFLSWPIILSITFPPTYNFYMLEGWLESHKLHDFSSDQWVDLSLFVHSSRAHREPLAYLPQPLSWMSFASIIIKRELPNLLSVVLSLISTFCY